MTQLADSTRVLEPGTTGWCASDLDDPVIERQWEAGRYEIVEGVLATMPPALYDANQRLFRLMCLIEDHQRQLGAGGGMAPECDVILSEFRVAKADAVYLSPADKQKQRAAVKATGRRPERGRILVPPTLVIESISRGHEAHDRNTKRQWYADAGVPNYWIFDFLGQSLECLLLKNSEYRIDATGKRNEEVRPSGFPGLVIPLAELWAD
jgi:Uma2 family endonuclease